MNKSRYQSQQTVQIGEEMSPLGVAELKLDVLEVNMWSDSKITPNKIDQLLNLTSNIKLVC